MVALSNTCEGTATATVTTSNTGGPDQFSSVALGSGAVIFYATSPAHGSTCIKFSGNGTKSCTWGSALIGTVSNAYGRAYMRVDTLPTVATRVLRWIGSGSTRASISLLNTSAKLVIKNSAGTTLATSTTALTTGTWYRLEFDITNISGSTGDLVLRIYTSIDSSTAAETLTASGASIGGTVDSFEFGSDSNSAVLSFDEIGYSSTGPVGPVATPITGTATSTLAALTQAAAGTIVPPAFTGTAASTLAPLTQAAAGIVAAPGATTGTAASTLAPLTQAAAGTATPPAYTGTAVSTLAPLTQAAAGTTGSPGATTGTAASVLPALTQMAAGVTSAPVSITAPPSTLTFDSPDASSSNSGSLGGEIAALTFKSPAGWFNNQRDYDKVTGELFLHDGLHPYGPITQLRGVVWQEELSKPGSVTFEVAESDPVCSHIGPIKDGPKRIVKLTLWKEGVPIATVACRIDEEATQHVVDGTVWHRWEDTPGLLQLLADANVQTQDGGLPEPGETDRWFGPMCPADIGGWFHSGDWGTPRGIAYLDDPVAGRHGNPDLYQFRAHNPAWIAAAGPAHSVTFGRKNYFRCVITVPAAVDAEALFTADNFLGLWIDNQQLYRPDYSDPFTWQNANPVRIHLSAGEHVIYAEVENAKRTTGANPLAFIGMLFALDSHGNIASVIAATNTTDWKVAVGPPEPSWAGGQILRQLVLEAKARFVHGPLQLRIGFGPRQDSHGRYWGLGDTKAFPIAQVDLLDVGAELCEIDMDIGVDPVSMTLHAWQRRGKDRRATVSFLPGASSGLTDYSTKATAPQANSLLMQLANQSWVKRENDDTIDTSGRMETGFELGSTGSDRTAIKIADSQIAESGHYHLETSGSPAFGAGPGPFVYVHCHLGDTVTVADATGEPVAARIIAITVDATSDLIRVTPEFALDETAA